ncbi:MAG: tRNA glutamyl-Q(34) synthetase GluQRS [Celeribacter sp.]|jgi:glutamyl-Q tRNA(Asp) synthetase
MLITRFAPSPTGPLHLGHAYSALLAADLAGSAGGEFLLRIEDLDRERSKPKWEEAILEDLRWLGIHHPRPVWRQSDRLPAYDAALDRLADLDLLYPCSCNRAEIRAALSAPQEGDPPHGPDGVIYPGTCRRRSMRDRQPGDAIRLDMKKASEAIARELSFRDEGDRCFGDHLVDPAQLVSTAGDIILARRQTGAIAYHLAVVVDDAAQGVTLVTRGRDLFDATPLHVVLQHLLALPTPRYHHHRLIRDATGKRLAKRHDAEAIHVYRERGASPYEIREMVGL